MLLNRRGLLVGLGALFAAPAIVRASSLMPVKAVRTAAEIVNDGLWGVGPVMGAKLDMEAINRAKRIMLTQWEIMAPYAAGQHIVVVGRAPVTTWRAVA